jgi:hypothetical protein
MVVQVLYNYENRPDVAGMVNPFTDVAEGAWYHDAVVWAAANGLVSGVSASLFAPDSYITRAHVMIILNNYAEFAKFELPALRNSQLFTDDIDVRDYAREAIDRFFRAMIIHGRPDGSFEPQGNVTRGELAGILSGFVIYSENLAAGGYDNDNDALYEPETRRDPRPSKQLPIPPYGYVDEPDADEQVPMPPYGHPPPYGYVHPAYGIPGCIS